MATPLEKHPQQQSYALNSSNDTRFGDKDKSKEKPLPPSPFQKSQHLHALSTTHRGHLINLISSSVECEDLSSSWVKSIEHATDQLALSMFNEGWISGLRRAAGRRVGVEEKERSERREAMRKEREREKERKAKRGDSKNVNDPRCTSGGAKPIEREHSLAYSIGTENTLKSLDDLRRRTKKRHHISGTRTDSEVSNIDVPYHLLLCLQVTPSSSTHHHYSTVFSSLGTDPASASERITIALDPNLNFHSGHFTIPDSPSSTLSTPNEMTTILFGLNEWQSSISGSEELTPEPILVGGTFLLKPTTPRICTSVSNVLRLAVYARLSMILEQCFLSDLGIELEFPSPASFSKQSWQGSGFKRILSLRERVDSINKPSGIGDTEGKMEGRHSLRRKLWSFVANKTDRILQRYMPNGQVTDSERNLDSYSTGNDSEIESRGREMNKEYLKRSASLDLRSLSSIRDKKANVDVSSNTIRRSSADIGPPVPLKDRETLPPFTYTLTRLRENVHLLTTSPSVRFPLPLLLQTLSEKERSLTQSLPSSEFPFVSEKERTRKLRGDERAGLETILGWEGRESRGRGMVGLIGFVRQQQIGVLCSASVPGLVLTVEKGQKAPNSNSTALANGSTPPSMNENSSGEGSANDTARGSASFSTTTTLSKTNRTQCMKYHFRTLSFFSRDMKDYYQSNEHTHSHGTGIGTDIPLGGFISLLCNSAKERCEHRLECDHVVGAHEWEWLHDGVSVRAGLVPRSSTSGSCGKGKVKGIQMWSGCMMCSRTSVPKEMSEGTYMLSFGKFLELLIYSSLLQSVNIKLCDHTSQNAEKLARCFAHGDHVLKFTRSETNPVLDLRIPWLQFERGLGMGEKWGGGNARTISLSYSGSGDVFQGSCGTVSPEAKGEKREILKMNEDIAKLTREITDWFGGLDTHLTKVNDTLELFQGDLVSETGTPSTESGTSRLGTEASTINTENMPTPKPRLSSLPPSEESLMTRDSKELSSGRLSIDSNSKIEPDEPMTPTGGLAKLSKLKHLTTRRQQDLLLLLSASYPMYLNDVRRRFKSEGNQLKRMTEAWLDKYFKPLNLASGQHLMTIKVEQPGWWDERCHAVPGSRYIVKDGDWGTIIASTLGSADYHKELAAMAHSGARHSSVPKRASPLATVPQSDPGSPASSISSRSVRSVTPTPSQSASVNTLTAMDLHGLPPHSLTTSELTVDSEQDYASSPEQYTTSVSRREHPRDLSALSILTFPLWSTDSSGRSTQDSSAYSRFSSISEAATRLINPRSASTSSAAIPVPTTSARAKASAVELSTETAGGESARGRGVELTDRLTAQAQTGSDTPKSSPRKIHDPSTLAMTSNENPNSTTSAFKTLISRSDSTAIVSALDTTTTFAQILQTSPASPCSESPPPPSLKGAVDHPTSKLVNMNVDPRAESYTDDQLNNPKLGSVPGGISPNKRHALLATGESRQLHNVDQKPHIKCEWTIGNRLKYSCTVYYAQQFDSLRNRCGVGEILPQSLAATMGWAAEGGKSKSSFWKTQDNRFIIKTLVNSWNVTDLQVLVDIAPAYFRYMEHTTSHASVLAKLMGFYTVEMSNLVTGDRAVVNLLVMENLFYNHHITRTFDLKGIAGRKRKVNAKSETLLKTLFDAEWLEGQKSTPAFVNSHSNAVLQQAIRADAEFLSKNLIMDYSLLLGLDEERHQLVCGLIDTIGSFSLAKTLEWRVKQGINTGLNSGAREPTVVPPQDYNERFVKAIETYFLPCPDKWTKPPGFMNLHSVEDLPSVS